MSSPSGFEGADAGVNLRSVPPILSATDRAAARESALAARRLRSDLKKQLGSRELTLREILDLSHENTLSGRAAARLRVGEVLLALPGVGAAKADTSLVEAGINGNRRIKGLGVLQVQRLTASLVI